MIRYSTDSSADPSQPCTALLTTEPASLLAHEARIYNSKHASFHQYGRPYSCSTTWDSGPTK